MLGSGGHRTQRAWAMRKTPVSWFRIFPTGLHHRRSWITWACQQPSARLGAHQRKACCLRIHQIHHVACACWRINVPRWTPHKLVPLGNEIFRLVRNANERCFQPHDIGRTDATWVRCQVEGMLSVIPESWRRTTPEPHAPFEGQIPRRNHPLFQCCYQPKPLGTIRLCSSLTLSRIYPARWPCARDLLSKRLLQPPPPPPSFSSF